MNVRGSFTTATAVAELRALSTRTALLERVSTLSDVTSPGDGVVHAVFAPVVALGRIPLRTSITTVHDGEHGATLAVVGRRGHQSVDVRLELEYTEAGEGTTVAWSAEVVVRGNMASVGQRVAGDVATRAISSVLEEAAAVAGDGARAVAAR